MNALSFLTVADLSVRDILKITQENYSQTQHMDQLVLLSAEEILKKIVEARSALNAAEELIHLNRRLAREARQ